MTKRPSLSLLLPLLILVGCEPAQELPATGAYGPHLDRLIAVIHPTEGHDVTGVVTFSREGDDVRVRARVQGLNPESLRGFHIHEYGDCSAGDAMSAGGHFNPYGMPHAGPEDDRRHMGDLGNLEADEDGVAVLDYLDPVIELAGEGSILGRGVVVHAQEDDLETQPTGDAGARIGCGVIGVAQPNG